MTKVIGVRFRTAGKIYFFSPGKLEIKTGDKVIVETARGVEFGSVVTGPKEVEDDKITQPLKSVIRSVLTRFWYGTHSPDPLQAHGNQFVRLP